MVRRLDPALANLVDGMISKAHGHPDVGGAPRGEAPPGESSAPEPDEGAPPEAHPAVTTAELRQPEPEPEPEPATEPDRIPYSRFEEVRQEREQYRQEAERRERELADLRAQLDRDEGSRQVEGLLSPENLPESWDEMSEVQRYSYVAQQAAKATAERMGGFQKSEEYQRMSLHYRIAGELDRPLTPKQTNTLVDLAMKHGRKLPARHLLVMAQTDYPEVFHVEPTEAKAKTPTASVPPSHRVQQPTNESRRTTKPKTRQQMALEHLSGAYLEGDRGGMRDGLNAFLNEEFVRPHEGVSPQGGRKERLVVKSTRKKRPGGPF